MSNDNKGGNSGIMQEENEARLFCTVCVRLGYITQEQCDAALAEQKVDRTMGKEHPIGSYLVNMGLLTRDQIREALKAQHREVGPKPAGGNLLETRAEDGFVKDLFSQLRQLSYPSLFPVIHWIKDRPWNLIWVRFFAIFAFYPLLMGIVYSDGIALSEAAWLFGLYFALIWGTIIFFSLRPGPAATKGAFLTALFTATLGVAMVLSFQNLPVIKDFYDAASSANFLGRIFGFIFGVGLLEELVKGLPLYWIFIHKGRDTTPRAAAFLGAVSGLAFGVAEAVSYSILYALGREVGVFGYGDYIVLQMLRLISLPLLHALWSGLLGFFIGLAQVVPSKAKALCLVGLLTCATLHGLYNVFSGGWGGLTVAVVTFLAFIGYARSAEKVAREIA